MVQHSSANTINPKQHEHCLFIFQAIQPRIFFNKMSILILKDSLTHAAFDNKFGVQSTNKQICRVRTVVQIDNNILILSVCAHGKKGLIIIVPGIHWLLIVYIIQGERALSREFLSNRKREDEFVVWILMKKSSSSSIHCLFFFKGFNKK